MANAVRLSCMSKEYPANAETFGPSGILMGKFLGRAWAIHVGSDKFSASEILGANVGWPPGAHAHSTRFEPVHDDRNSLGEVSSLGEARRGQGLAMSSGELEVPAATTQRSRLPTVQHQRDVEGKNIDNQ